MGYGGSKTRSVIDGLDWSLTTIATLTVIARILSRTKFTKNFGHDDALIILALLVQLIYVSSLTSAISAGLGKHGYDVPKQQLPLIGFRQVWTSSIGVWTFALPKLAIVALLERLLSLNMRTRAIFWTLSLGLVLCCGLLSIFWFVQCTPRAHQWNPEIPGSCWNPSIVLNLSYFAAALSGFLDFLFAIHPLFIVARLNMPLHKRVAVSAALMGGIPAGIVTFYKISLISEISAEAKMDPTYADIPLLFWTVIETDILIAAASLPAVGPFWRYIQDVSSRIYSRGSRVSTPPFRNGTQWGKPEGGSPWFGGRSKGMTSLGSQQDDVQLVELQPNRLQPRPGRNSGEKVVAQLDRQPGREEIYKQVDIEASSEQATSSERETAKFQHFPNIHGFSGRIQ